MICLTVTDNIFLEVQERLAALAKSTPSKCSSSRLHTLTLLFVIDDEITDKRNQTAQRGRVFPFRTLVASLRFGENVNNFAQAKPQMTIADVARLTGLTHYKVKKALQLAKEEDEIIVN